MQSLQLFSFIMSLSFVHKNEIVYWMNKMFNNCLLCWIWTQNTMFSLSIWFIVKLRTCFIEFEHKTLCFLWVFDLQLSCALTLLNLNTEHYVFFEFCLKIIWLYLYKLKLYKNKSIIVICFENKSCNYLILVILLFYYFLFI